jgi:hypothetical protein
MAVRIVTVISTNEQPVPIMSHSQRSLPEFLGISDHKMTISASTKPTINTEPILLPGESHAKHFYGVGEYC